MELKQKLEVGSTKGRNFGEVSSQAPPDGFSLPASATLLLIDDNPAEGRFIQHALKDKGKVLQWFIPPVKGEMDLSGIDLIILDYLMPEKSGLEVLREIRAIDARIPVIFSTAFGDGDLKAEAISAGASEYISKPFGVEHLRSVVSRFLGDEGFVEERQDDNPVEAAGRRFTGRTVGGFPFEGVLQTFDAGTVRVLCTAIEKLEKGDRLETSSLSFGSSEIIFSNAVIIDLIPGERGTEVVISTPDRVSVRSLGGDILGKDPEAGSGMDALMITELMSRHSDEGAEERARLPESLRITVTDFADSFQEIRNDLNSLQSRLTGVEPGARIALEATALEIAETRFFERLTAAVIRFEAAATEARVLGLEKEFARFARRRLFSLVLSSPFMSRIVERPIGVPGDFEMLGQILGPRFRGHSLYGRLINQWILSNPATDAYRFRIALLEKTTREAAVNGKCENRRVKVLSMASGVAYEVQHYVQNPVPGVKVDFTLVDFSPDTLDEAKRQFAKLGSLPPEVTITFEVSSVIELANWSRSQKIDSNRPGFVPEESYDVVYCAGLFDYLKDRLIVSVTNYLDTLVAPGGALVVSNYTTKNPFSNFMGIVLDWELIYRSVTHFDDLVKKALGDKTFEMLTDDHGVEAYALRRNLS